MVDGQIVKNIMKAMSNSAFIISLFGSFRDEQYLIFVMEPGLGGELFEL